MIKLTIDDMIPRDVMISKLAELTDLKDYYFNNKDKSKIETMNYFHCCYGLTFFKNELDIDSYEVDQYKSMMDETNKLQLELTFGPRLNTKPRNIYHNGVVATIPIGYDMDYFE